MYHVVQLLNEAIETEDVSLLNIDPKEESYTKEKDDELWQEAYTMASVKLKESYDRHSALYREAIQNTRESINKNRAVVHNEKRPPVKVSLHMITVSPQIDCNVFRLVDKFFEDTNLDSYKSSDGVVSEFIGKICSDAGCNQISKDMFTGPIILANICDDIIIDNVHMLATRVPAAADELYHIYEFLAKKIRDDRNVTHLEAYVRVFDVCAKVISAKISAYGVSLLEILQVANIKPADRNILMEAVEYSEEDAKKYLNEIDNLIDEIRAFYDDFKYKEIITPRKKKQEKMMQYVLGALQRKYTLKIPIYKVSGVTDEVKDIVENKFIDKLESITKKYPNFVIMSPSWDDDTDMFIYITLREPFGEKEDRKDREQQAQNEAIDINDQISALQKQIDHNEKAQSVYEAKNGKSDEKLLKEHDKMCDDMEALCKKRRTQTESISYHSETLVEASLTKEEKDNLKPWEFGLPDKRKYPLNDYTRIKKAIEFFGYCDAEDKKTLADNIVRRVIELNLVGSITVSDKHPNKDYFPEWMRYHKDDVSLTINGNKYTITLKGEKVDWGTLPNHDESESDIQITNESGQLF